MDFENWDFLRQREEQKLFDIEVDEDDVNYKYRIVRSNEYANLYNDIKDFLINISDGEQAVNIAVSYTHLDVYKRQEVIQIIQVIGSTMEVI